MYILGPYAYLIHYMFSGTHMGMHFEPSTFSGNYFLTEDISGLSNSVLYFFTFKLFVTIISS